MTPEEIVPLVAIVAPEYKDDPRMAGAILLAIPQVAADHCFRSHVIVLLAAHSLSLADKGGSGATGVVEEREGGLSRRYAERRNETGVGYELTGYGREVTRLNFLCYGMSARTQMF